MGLAEGWVEGRCPIAGWILDLDFRRGVEDSS
jgi:hypothetical protein